MNIFLYDEYIWEIDPIKNHVSFIQNLEHFLKPSDFLVIGAYEPDKNSLKWIRENSLKVETKYYRDSYDANRLEHPNGGSYMFHPTTYVIDHLIEFTLKTEGNLPFFDDLIAYRIFDDHVHSLINFYMFYKVEGYISTVFNMAELEHLLDGQNVEFKKIENEFSPHIPCSCIVY